MNGTSLEQSVEHSAWSNMVFILLLSYLVSITGPALP